MNMTESSISLAEAVAKAHRQRTKAMDTAAALFEEARTPRQRELTAANLMETLARTDVEFTRLIRRAHEVMETQHQAKLAAGKPESGGH